MVGRKVVALLMCVAVALIAAPPVAQSWPGVHEIVKDENGPPSACAESWGVTPSRDWTWHGHIVNYGLACLIIDVIDIETGDLIVDREMYRFAHYPEGWVDTEKIDLVAGHTYWITATPMGPIGSRCTVEDVLEGGPVAAFTVSVDGATVFVDASASYDIDGTIVSYDWDWGDGTTGTGVTATHTYVEPEGAVASSTSTLGLPQHPYLIYGVTKDVEGNPLPHCTVTVTNDNNGGFLVTESGADGVYLCNIANMGELYPYADGDLIIVEAVKSSLSLSGVSQGYVDLSGQLTMIDVVLEPGNVWVITLTVTDNDGLTGTISQPIVLEYLGIPPVASFTVYFDGLAVHVDASESNDPDGTITDYDWDWGDGITGTGVTATHTYAAAGTYTIMLTVTDDHGLTGATSKSVMVGKILPVADFTVIVDGLTVAVDASASYDPDGAIVSYDWDWGDGTTGTGVTATHTYVEPEGAVAPSTPTLGWQPYYIYGVTMDTGGNPIPYCTVTITNTRNGGVATVTSLADGKYVYNLLLMGEDYWYTDGDLIIVEAVRGSLAGSAQGYVDLSGVMTIIDVVLEGDSVPFDVTITLTVMDNDGMSSSVSRTMTLYP